jgi:hypothetical protein
MLYLSITAVLNRPTPVLQPRAVNKAGQLCSTFAGREAEIDCYTGPDSLVAFGIML